MASHGHFTAGLRHLFVQGPKFGGGLKVQRCVPAVFFEASSVYFWVVGRLLGLTLDGE